MKAVATLEPAAEGYANAVSNLAVAQDELAEAGEQVRKAQEECSMKLAKFQRAVDDEQDAWYKLVDARIKSFGRTT